MIRSPLVAAAMLCATISLGQASGYPSKQIKLIVPFPPAASTTAVARFLAEKMTSQLGKEIVVVPQGGAFGLIGTDAIAKSEPDGYTIGWCNDGPIATVTAGMRKAGRVPPYDFRSFTPIVRTGYVTFVMVVRSDLSVNTIADLVAYARSNPGKLNAASAHPTGTLSIALLNKRRDTNILDVRYWQSGEPDALRDLLRGDVHIMVSTLFNARPHAESGAVRILGTLGAQRSSVAPNIPTLAESGFPEFGGVVGETWGALCGPIGMPKDVVARLREVAISVLRDENLVAQFARTGWAVRGSTEMQIQELFRTSERDLRTLLDETGVQIYGQ